MKKSTTFIMGAALLALSVGSAMAQQATKTTDTTVAQPAPVAAPAPISAPQQVVVPVGPPATDAITGKPVENTSTAGQKKAESLRDKVRNEMGK